MEAEEGSRKRKVQEFLANDEFIDLRPEEHNTTALSLDQKRRRFNEESTIMKDDNVEERYYHHRMRLDLELNLSPSLIDLNRHDDHDLMSDHNKDDEEDKMKKKKIEKGLVLGLQTRENMAWVALDELDDDGEGGAGCGGGKEEEMMARVCVKCHMLVMLYKASPVCPNCKFMHSLNDTSPSLLFTPKPTLLA